MKKYRTGQGEDIHESAMATLLRLSFSLLRPAPFLSRCDPRPSLRREVAPSPGSPPAVGCIRAGKKGSRLCQVLNFAVDLTKDIVDRHTAIMLADLDLSEVTALTYGSPHVRAQRPRHASMRNLTGIFSVASDNRSTDFAAGNGYYDYCILHVTIFTIFCYP